LPLLFFSKIDAIYASIRSFYTIRKYNVSNVKLS
jgi:hypothetical protein